MSNPTIVGLVRPQLNLSKPYNQAAHLAEHLFLSSKACRDLRQVAVSVNGYTSELYMALYGVTLGPSQHLAAKLANLSLPTDKKSHHEGISTLKQELLERLPNKALGEQFVQAVYTPDSPAVQQPFFSEASVKLTNKITPDLSPAFLVTLSYDSFEVPPIEIKRNQLNEEQFIRLRHPDQSKGLTDVTIYYPLDINNTNFAFADIWSYGLGDYEYGRLYAVLREAGLIYDIDIYPDLYSNALCIHFSIASKNVARALGQVDKTINALTINQETINSYQNDLYLKWQDPRRWALRFLEESIIGGVTTAPSERKINLELVNTFCESMKKVSSKVVLRECAE